MDKIYDLKRDGVTQSVLIGWLQCREKTRLGLVEGWTSIKPKTVFQFGDLYHGTMEVIYKEAKKFRKNFPEEDYIDEIISLQVKRWHKENPMVQEDIVEAIELNTVLLRAILPRYFKYWHKQDFVQTRWVELEKEFEMKLDVKGFPLTIRGKRDGAYKEGKGIYLFESKTKSQIDERTLYDLLAFDFQTDLYSLGIEKDYGVLPRGVRYNVVRKPGQKLKRHEELKQFGERVRKEVERDPKHYFKRFRIYRPLGALRLYRKELIELLHDFIMWNQGKAPHYRNTGSCSNRYGTCGFLPICANHNYKSFKRKTTPFKELSYRREA